MWQQILHIDQQLLLALNGSWGGFWDTFFYIVTARLDVDSALRGDPLLRMAQDRDG